MTELLRHQSSIAYYDRNRSGCMWGLFKFLHMHKHLHRSKRLSYRYAKNNVAGTEHLRLGRNDASAENEPMLDKKAAVQMENKVCTKKRSSGAAHIINLLYKKMIKKKDHKLKVSSSASHLIRTLSVHHLECNDYIIPDNSFSDTDPSPFDFNSNELAVPENENISQSPKHIEGPAFDKQRIKDAIKENIKMEHLITLDGVLDKIPIDQKMNGKMQGDKRSKFGSEGYVDINSRLAKRTIQRSRSLTESLEKYSNELEDHASFLRSNSVNSKDNTFTDRRTLRSHSLNESFEIYSRLLESVSVRDNQQHHQRLSSVREHDGTYAHRRTSRSRSLSGSLDVYSRILESVSNIEYKKQPERLRSVEEDVNRHSELRLPSLNNDLSNEISLQSIEKQEPNLPIIDNTMPVGLFFNVEEAKDGGEKIVNQTEIYGSPNQSELISERNQSGEIMFDTDIKEGLIDISPKPTPVSVLDSIVDEDPVSPIYTCNEADAKPQSWICFEELGDSKSVEHTGTSFSGDGDGDDRNLTIEDLEFNYVRTVLMKSRFCEGLNEFLSAWYSSYEPGDQLLFVDEESIKDEIFYDMGLDHRLFLLDLINEILMEFYERSIASITGLTRYSSCVKPLFVGDRLIQEVWEKVNWHLSSSCDALEWEESRYFTKRDGWVNLLFDVEGVGIEMESLILDELIDELVDDCFRS